MAKVKAEFNGRAYEFFEADVLACQRFWGCDYEDALYMLWYDEYSQDLEYEEA